MDLAFAAAFSKGENLGSPQKKRKAFRHTTDQQGQGNGFSDGQSFMEDFEDQDWELGGDLPTVDDLEVAALAAEAAMEAVNIKDSHLLDGEEASDSEEAEAESSSSSEDEDMESSSAHSEVDEALQNSANNKVAVALQVTGTGRVEVQCTVNEGYEMRRVESLAGSDIVDPEVLRDMLSRMDEGGDDARAAAREAEEEKAGLPPVERLEVEIGPADTLLPTGTVTAVLGDQIIVQAPKGTRAVDEGSVLCLASRQALGRVEEIFGPVDEPLYSLRYACGSDLPTELQPGAAVLSLERMSSYILPDKVKVNPERENLDIDGDDDPDEFEFSDDDAEAVFQKMAPKEVSTSQPKAVLQRPGRSQTLGRRGGRGRSQGRESDGPDGPQQASYQQRSYQPHQAAGQQVNGYVGMSMGSRGSQQGRRGRGREAPRVRLPNPVRPRPAAAAEANPPAGGGKWVWIPEASQEQPQAQAVQPIRPLPKTLPRPQHPRGYPLQQAPQVRSPALMPGQYGFQGVAFPPFNPTPRPRPLPSAWPVAMPQAGPQAPYQVQPQAAPQPPSQSFYPHGPP